VPTSSPSPSRPSLRNPSGPSIGIALAAHEPPVAFFAAQLASIVAQTDADWFCVVTLDSPLAPLRDHAELAPFFADSRFRWCENEKRLGVAHNFARAFRLALEAGPVAIAPSDQDDLWYPQKLAVLRRELASKPPLGLVHSDMDLLVGTVIQPHSGWVEARRDVSRVSPEELLIWNVATGAAMLLDAELVRKYPTIPPGVRYHDHFYALAASLHGGVHPVHERLYAYRQHAGNVIGAQAYRGLLGGQRLEALYKNRSDAVRNFESMQALSRAFAGEAPELARLVDAEDAGARLFWYGLKSLPYKSLARESFALSWGKMLGRFRSSDRIG
jgi:hypothetical protein